MAHTLRVQWTLIPAHPPRPLRHCAACGDTRPFESSGKVRLNANGRRLDAWLIYRCAECGRTWLRAILERCSVQHISRAELDAMEQSSPAWVRRHEFDIAALKRFAETVVQSDGLVLIKPVFKEPTETPRTIELSLLAPSPTGLRLDRFLSHELSLSRARIGSAHRNGGVVVNIEDDNALRRKIRNDVTIKLHSSAFSDVEFLRMCVAVFTT